MWRCPKTSAWFRGEQLTALSLLLMVSAEVSSHRANSSQKDPTACLVVGGTVLGYAVHEGLDEVQGTVATGSTQRVALLDHEPLQLECHLIGDEVVVALERLDERRQDGHHGVVLHCFHTSAKESCSVSFSPSVCSLYPSLLWWARYIAVVVNWLFLVISPHNYEINVESRMHSYTYTLRTSTSFSHFVRRIWFAISV